MGFVVHIDLLSILCVAGLLAIALVLGVRGKRFRTKAARVAGWVVAVDRPGGVVLYVVAAPIHIDAEQIVRRNLGLPEADLAVQASRSVDQAAIDKWGLKPGEMKGPM